MDERRGEFITTNKPPIVAKFLLYELMVKNSESDGRFADPTGANESGGGVGSDESEDLFDELVPSEEQSWSRRRRFTEVSIVSCQRVPGNLNRETTNTSFMRYKVSNAQPTWIEIQLTGVELRIVGSVFANLCTVC